MKYKLNFKTISLLIFSITFSLTTDAFSQDFWEKKLDVSQTNAASGPYHFVQNDNGDIYGTYVQKTKMHRSDDEGNTWIDITGNLPYSWPWDYCNYKALCKGNILFTYVNSMDQKGVGIYKSLDKGDTWANVSADLGVDTNVVEMDLLPNGNLLAYTRTMGSPDHYKMYLSPDDGDSWTVTIDFGIHDIDAVWINSLNEVFIRNYHTLYKSVDYGLSWDLINSNYTYYVTHDTYITSTGIELSSSQSSSEPGFIRSEDNCLTWLDCTDSGLVDIDIQGHCITQGDTIYANVGVYGSPYTYMYSIDLAETWDSLSTTGILEYDNISNAMAITKSGYLLASVYYDGIYRSVEPVSSGTTNMDLKDKNIDVNLYPNPSSRKVVIESNNIQTIEIFDMKGNLLFQNNYNNISSLTLNVTKYPIGIFNIKIYTDKTISTKKLVIN